MPQRRFAKRFRSSVKNGAPAISVGNINFNEDHPYPVVEFLTSLIGGGATCILYGRSLGHDRAQVAWHHERHSVHHVVISADGYGVNI